MYLGKLCRFAGECSVYQQENIKINKPVFLIRNVFCNRGAKGWNNCRRFLMYQEGKPVDKLMVPNG